MAKTADPPEISTGALVRWRAGAGSGDGGDAAQGGQIRFGRGSAGDGIGVGLNYADQQEKTIRVSGDSVGRERNLCSGAGNVDVREIGWEFIYCES